MIDAATDRAIPAACAEPPRPPLAQPPADMPIPNRLNVALVAFVATAAVALLWFGSWVDHWLGVGAVGVAFSYLLLTNYALLHEATHGNLHSRPRWNYWLGVVAGTFFPVPFSMIHTTHQGHHLRNRTDFEMFDLYYATDSKLLKFAQWYSILCGLFWPVVPLGGLIAAIYPQLLNWRPFRQARSSSYLCSDIRDIPVWAIRLEVLGIVGFFAALYWLLQLSALATLFMYGCFAFNWSTRQYVGHAFTKRDVIDGAWNLRHWWPMTWVLLHGEWDLNHHRRPEVSWYYLPRLVGDESRPSYVRQYWRLWRGPRLATEPAPESLAELPLSVRP
ncbi:MAG: fatty acid desaturase [Planctomycetia bacterium]|nr:fatty acid desaturase [Planctomycetia bacterium]